MNTTTTALLIAEPELGEPRCPNGHDSSIPPAVSCVDVCGVSSLQHPSHLE